MSKHVLLLILGFVLFSCTSKKATNEFTCWVNSYKVDCVGAGPMKCMLIQKGDALVGGEWQNFYAPIEGFNYQPGFIYKLRVREKELKDVPADASSIKYTLVKLLDKQADSKLNINDIWVATSIAGKEIALKEEQGRSKNAHIEVHISEMRVMGSDGCNNFNGSIARFDDGILELGPIAGTRMMCMDMTIPDKFNTALGRVKKFKLSDGKLVLFDNSGNVLITFKKVD